MKPWLPMTLVCAFGTISHAQAACNYPQSPAAPPDGSTASKEQMIAAKHDFDRYNTDMNSYLDCLKLEIDSSAAPKDPTKMTAEEKKAADERQKSLVAKNNAAVDELQANVGRFNEQLKIYKAKNK